MDVNSLKLNLALSQSSVNIGCGNYLFLLYHSLIFQRTLSQALLERAIQTSAEKPFEYQRIYNFTYIINSNLIKNSQHSVPTAGLREKMVRIKEISSTVCAQKHDPLDGYSEGRKGGTYSVLASAQGFGAGHTQDQQTRFYWLRSTF